MPGLRLSILTMFIAMSCVAFPQGDANGLPSFVVRFDYLVRESSPQGARLADAEAYAKIGLLVVEIKRADFEDNRAILKELSVQLEPFTSDQRLASFAYYWRGFALWRRSLNGFNDGVNRQELGDDLESAVHEFASAQEHAPGFVEATIAEAGCEGTLTFLHQGDPEQMKGHIERWVKLMNSAQKASPDNPRLLWVLGGSLWGRPASAGGSQTAGMETYQRGLISANKPPTASTDSLEPSWGKAELLMSIAWAKLYQSKPDPIAAQKYASEALQLAPNWHYVRYILLPQIIQAKETLSKARLEAKQD